MEDGEGRCDCFLYVRVSWVDVLKFDSWGGQDIRTVPKWGRGIRQSQRLVEWFPPAGEKEREDNF